MEYVVMEILKMTPAYAERTAQGLPFIVHHHDTEESAVMHAKSLAAEKGLEYGIYQLTNRVIPPVYPFKF